MAKVLPVIITSKADATNGGFLHVPPQWREYCKNIMNTKTAVIMIASERGGLLGPSDIYPALADDLASNHNIPALRLDHEHAGTRSVPANLLGVDGAIKYLQKNLKVHQIILVGWEWGGKLTLGAAAPIAHTSKCIVGIATIASKGDYEACRFMLEASSKRRGHMPVLMFHSEGDERIPVAEALALKQMYTIGFNPTGWSKVPGRKGEKDRYRISKATIGLPRKSTPTAEVPLREYRYNDVAEDANIALRVFPDDIHELYQYSVEVRAMICGFCIEVSKGVVAGAEEVKTAGLVSNRMRPDLKPRKA